MAKKPLPFRYQRVSLCIDPTTAKIYISTQSTTAYAEASAYVEHLPTTHLIQGDLQYR
jgi:hypothetical protein